MTKTADAFRTISEVAEELELPQHVLRFWETRFIQIKPLKRAGGRRYYRPHDIELLRLIKHLLYQEGYTIRGVQRVLKENPSSAFQVPGNKTESPIPNPAITEPQVPDPVITEPQDFKKAPAPILDVAEQGASESRSNQISNPVGSTLTPEMLGQLREILAEVTECVNILAAARSRFMSFGPVDPK